MALPPKPKQEPQDLAEVERALSILHGRHPEHERIRREDTARRLEHKAAIDSAAAAETKRARKRAAVIGAIAFVALGIVTGITLYVRRDLARRARIVETAERYRSLGFTLVDSSSRGEPGKLQASVSPGCFLAASSVPGARVRLAHGAVTVDGTGSAMTCLCEDAQVTVMSEVPPSEGVVLLRTDTNTLGGSRAFAFLPFQPGALGRSDDACAEASLDAWLDAKKWANAPENVPRPSSSPDKAKAEAWFSADPRRAVFRDVGFEIGATLAASIPFTLVSVPAEFCVLLVPERSDEKVSLRAKGGERVVGPGAGNTAWCTSTESTLLAQREGQGGVTVLIGSAARVGGLLGLREAAEGAGLPLAQATVAAADRPWDAKQFLVASSVPDGLVKIANAPDFPADTEARVVVVSAEKANSLAPESPAEVFSFCDPPLDRATSSLCIFSGPQRWRVEAGADVVAGLARAQLPFWLFGFQGVNEPVALKVETQVIKLARKLRRAGFEPTTIEAITELDKGTEVLGRANEDAMIVLGLLPAEPWVQPFTDGPSWTLDGEPRIVPIKPLQRVTVTAAAGKLPPKATRRTVVFRRKKR